MALSRRKTLALLGGGFIVAAGGTAALEVTRTPRTANAPWGQAGQYDDPRMRALSWAILAPNPHNQLWISAEKGGVSPGSRRPWSPLWLLWLFGWGFCNRGFTGMRELWPGYLPRSLGAGVLHSAQ